MYKSLLAFILTKKIESLPMSDLYLWAEKNKLIVKSVDRSGAFQMEDSDGRLVLFGNAADDELAVGICPIGYWPLGDRISESERRSLDDAYASAREYLQSVLQEKGSEQRDAGNYGFKSSKWIRGGGALFLYQDARDPLFGTEVAVSIVKNSEHEAY